MGNLNVNIQIPGEAVSGADRSLPLPLVHNVEFVHYIIF